MIRMKIPSVIVNKINPGIARDIISDTDMPMRAMKSAVIAIRKVAIEFINRKQIVRMPGGV